MRERDALVERLRDGGWIRSPAVEAAFRTVARERFLPADVPLEIAYGVDDAVVTKRDEHGVAISSVTGAAIQAGMLEQAGLQPGMAVLEIGSGGLNAALIAEIVGEAGRVVSVDIDPSVTARASASLARAGYGGRVEVLVADATREIPGTGRFDAVIVTVAAWDIAPAWLDRLTARGRLVLPLVMNGATRTVGFARRGDHLVSTSVEVAGFVPMQGAGGRPEQLVRLSDRVRLRFDSGAPADPGALDGVLDTPRIEAWSGVTLEHGVSFAGLQLWFAWHLPGFCLLSPADLLPFGAVHGAGLAWLAVRSALGGAGVEFGAYAHGPDGEAAAAAMIAQIRAWNRDAEPELAYWPASASRPVGGYAVMVKTHGVLTMSW